MTIFVFMKVASIRGSHRMRGLGEQRWGRGGEERITASGPRVRTEMGVVLNFVVSPEGEDVIEDRITTSGPRVKTLLEGLELRRQVRG